MLYTLDIILLIEHTNSIITKYINDAFAFMVKSYNIKLLIKFRLVCIDNEVEYNICSKEF